MNSTVIPDKTIDCIGLYCPHPLFLTREGIDSIQVGQILEVLADDPAAEEDLQRFAKRSGQEFLKIEKNGVKLRILIKRLT